MKRLPALTLLAVLATLAAGCGAQTLILGTEGNYLLTVRDAITPPGIKVPLVARFQQGDLLRGRAGHVIRFRQGDGVLLAAETDADGMARVTFTPPAPGDYVFTVAVAAAGLPDDPPEPRDLLVACRAADTPLAVVDLDKTVVASGFQTVLLGNPEPMEGSAEVLKRLADDHTIIYLTHRPDYFGPKSKDWLKAQGFPRGPVLLSTVGSFLKGSGTYKSDMIKTLKAKFTRVELGIGDKFSDVEAYHANGMTAILILPVPENATATDLRALADQVAALPRAIQVVRGWDQVEAILFAGRTFPPAAMEKELRALADEKAKQEAAEAT